MAIQDIDVGHEVTVSNPDYDTVTLVLREAVHPDGKDVDLPLFLFLSTARALALADALTLMATQVRAADEVTDAESGRPHA